MLHLLLSLGLAQAAESPPSNEVVQSGPVLGYGSSLRPDTGTESWSAMGGFSLSMYSGWFYANTTMGLLIIKLPPGSLFKPEANVGVGLAPWGRFGPHVAASAGFGIGLAGIAGHYGGIVGVGLGPVSVDLVHRRGGQFPVEPTLYRANTVQVSVQWDMGELD